MATSAIRELQMACLPVAIGSAAAIFSNLVIMKKVGEVRYTDKSVEVHPYKPWTDKSPQADAHFRAFKASTNCTEWTGYFIPLLWLYALYLPAIASLGLPSLLATVLHWSPALLGIGFASCNLKYVDGYIQSAKGRIPGFTRRLNCFLFTFAGLVIGVAVVGARSAGLLA